jgi:hypothetical protein
MEGKTMRRNGWAAVSGLVIGLSTAVAVLCAPSAASAVEWEVGYADEDESFDGCTGIVRVNVEALACFQKYGDIWWVTQMRPNSFPIREISVQWVNELQNSRGEWVIYRQGQCYYEGTSVARCNKNYYENSSKNALGGYGSRLAFKACVTGRGCSALSPWVYNDE